MTTASELVNKSTSDVIASNASKNEVGLANSLKTQSSQDISKFTGSTEKNLKNIVYDQNNRPKTFTVHPVKQVVKEVKSSDAAPTTSKVDAMSADEKFSLGKKTGINITDDASLAKAKAAAGENLASAKAKGSYDPSAAINKGMSSNPASTLKSKGDIETKSALPSFSLKGKTINSLFSDEEGDSGLGSLRPSGMGIAGNNDVIKSVIGDKIGMEDYNKIRDSYNTLSEFSSCVGLGDIFGFGNGLSDWYDAINDFLNTSIKYDFGYIVNCMLPVVKMLDIKGVNKVVDKVGAKGSVKVLGVLTSGGDQDKILKSVKKERYTMKTTKSSFKDQDTMDAADTIVAHSSIVNAKDYFTSKKDGNKSVRPSVNETHDVYNLAEVKEDSKTSKDFTDYCVGKDKADLLTAIPR